MANNDLNVQVSFGIQGMERQSYSHLLDEKVYLFARNTNIESDDETIALTNEHSNLLCSKFKPGYIVIGHKYDSLNSKIWFFLTEKEGIRDTDIDGNPIILRKSEIGFIKINSTISDIEDETLECGCDMKSILSEPLENQVQTEHCIYTTFISDECNNCLNFDPLFPVHDIILKQEACGFTMTFASKNNPPRYIILDNIDYYRYKGDINCGEDNREETCIDCDKLRLFPHFTQPYIYPKTINYGGSLRRGEYEFYIAYCDKLGNELTSYLSATNPVTIFDPSNIQLNQTTQFSNTNYAIKLKVDNLDKRFNFYKMVVIEKTEVNENISVFEEGIHPITDVNIAYTRNGNSNDTRISLNRLFMDKPVYKSFGGFVASNGYLFGYDYEVEKEWNLQPMVNLLGTYVKWQTVEATENLYEDGVNVALYKGYMRDEVYPLAIRFITDTGYKTSFLPLMSRPPRSKDIAEIYNPSTNNLDLISVRENGSECSTSDRKQRWQFYNTASVIGNSPNYIEVDNYITVEKETEEECIMPSVRSESEGRVILNITDDFYGLQDWIDEAGDTIYDPLHSNYNPKLINLLNPNGIISDCNMDDIFPYPICRDESQTGGCEGETCSVPEAVEDSVQMYISEISGEKIEISEKRYPWLQDVFDSDIGINIPKYQHSMNLSSCTILENKTNVAFDTNIYRGTGTQPTDDYRRTEYTTIHELYQRNNHYENNDCFTALPVPMSGNFFALNFTGTFHKQQDGGNLRSRNYFRTKNDYDSLDGHFEVVRDRNNLLSKVTAPVYPGFDNKLSIEALWFHIELTEEDTLVEISPETENGCLKDLSNGDGVVRFVVYDNCTDLKIIDSGTYNANEGKFILFKKSELRKESVLIALDTKIKEVNHSKKFNESSGESDTFYRNIRFYVTSTTCGCFTVKVREKEYYKAIVNYDFIEIGRKELFTTQCRYKVPKKDDCGVIPHKFGEFAYWESTEIYPDNSDLYDSNSMKYLDLDRLKRMDSETSILFQNSFVDSYDGDKMIWKESEVDFRCKPIRHFKFPDNTVIPFMSSDALLNFRESKVYPIGVTIDEKVIEIFLDGALKSGLITPSQRRSITGYEIARGDRTVDKSIIMKGLVSDMYEDPYKISSSQRTFFRNFPYNTLGSNPFISTTDERKTTVQHPFRSERNDRFSFISPEVYYGRPQVPSELVIDGFVYGGATVGFNEVKNHSEWVILGDNAYKLASNLAKAEVAMEAALNIATLSMESTKTMWFMLGVSSGGNPVGAGLSLASLGIYTAIQTANLAMYKIPKLKAQWLQIFEDRGSVYNFGSNLVSPKGFYNYFKPNMKEGDMLRGLVTKKYLSNGLDAMTEVENGKANSILVNNRDREDSIYLFTGSQYSIKYPSEYSGFDNYDLSPKNASRFLSSDSNCTNDTMSIRRIASMYATLKNYVPDQYGKIDEIKWLTTNHDSSLNNEWKAIFGGDIYISRVDLKNKFKFFNSNAVKLANRTPFKYSKKSNIGYTRFYVDNKSADEPIGSMEMPYLSSKYNLDCRRGGRKFYESEPSKFYLFAYGIPYFLVESEINANYRYAGEEPHEQFASRGINVEEWIQEDNVSIAYNNMFFYNNVYSRPQTGLSTRILPSYYDREKWDCLSESENGIAWSEPDNSEVSLSDPWTVFKPFNIYRFPFSYGKLISLNNIESTQVIGRFTDNMAIFNAVDVLRDRITPENETLGTGGIFATRPVQFSFTELGETGSQHRAMVSCEFGHFWTDAKRGKVFQLQPNANGLNAISDFSGKGTESGMRKWFKRHLPFKILKSVEGIKDTDVDNSFKGLGILMWWDSRFKRVFVTKRDYIAKKKCISYNNGIFYYNPRKCGETGDPVEISLNDSKYFKDVSWTVAYSPIYQTWVSYYDFKPDYAIAHNDYFQTGLNYAENNSENGIWSHLLTNKSYQVFYGNKYPWTIELPVKNSHTNNVLHDLKIWSIAKRYHSNFDFAVWRKKSFNKMTVYNQTNNSGILHLKYDDSLNKAKYPISINNVEQGIPATHADEHISVNYFYNRVKNEEFHTPIWNWDENEINKELNSNAISFTSKRILERLRGDWFTVRLTQDSDTQFKQYFKWMVSKEQMY